MWSTTFQPTCAEPDSYKVLFEENCASFRRRDGAIETLAEIFAAADEAIEIRKVSLTNHDERPHEIELTSCAEVVIAPFAIDRHHPVFSNLFVQTEYLSEHNTILAMRRPRSALTDPVWCGHSLCFMDAEQSDVTCETDRMQFVGRGRSYRRPAAMDQAGDLSGRVGAVLDPVFALRTRMSIPSEKTVSVAFATFMATDHRHATTISGRVVDSSEVEKVISNARAASIDEDGAQLQQIAARLLFPSSTSRDETGNHADLRILGLSGDAPIILAHAEREAGRAGLEKVFLMQRYLDLKGIPTELVVLPSEDITSHQLEVLRSHASIEIECESLDLERIAQDIA